MTSIINLLIYAIAFVLSYVALLLMAGWLGAAEARLTACDPAPPNWHHEWWSWREIDGRRCFYRGRPGKPKGQLYWASQSEKVSEVAPEPSEPAAASAAPETVGAFDRAWRDILSDSVDPYFLTPELLTQKVPMMHGGNH